LFIAISIRVTGEDYSDTMEIMTSESPKCIVLMNKYKQCVPPGSLKRTGWKLLKVVTILNTNRVYSNPTAEQC